MAKHLQNLTGKFIIAQYLGHNARPLQIHFVIKSYFYSLKRHVSEGHKNVRPFGCTLCGKSYGRRDYLLRHLRSHNEQELAAISAGGSGSGSSMESPTRNNKLVRL